MSAVASNVEGKSQVTIRPKHQPYVFLVGGLAILLIIWSVLTIGRIANPRILIQLLALNITAQIVIVAIRRSGIAFAVNQAVNLATISLFGVQAGILVALLSHIVVWTIMTIRRKQPIGRAAETLLFNAGSEILALFVAGYTMLGLRHIIPDNWLPVRPLDWLVASIVNDQLNLAMLAIMLLLQRGTNPMEFWRRSVWAMPINITIGALGGALLANATLILGLRGILIFLLPLILAAYAFNVYMHVNKTQLSSIQSRVGDLEVANQQLAILSQKKESALDAMSVEVETSLIGIRTAVQTLLETRDYLPHEQRMSLLEQINQSEREIGRIVGSLDEVTVNPDDINTTPDPKLFNLSELVDSVTKSLEPMAETQQVRLRSHSGDVPSFIEADEAMIRQVIHHLVTNAIQFTKAGGSVFVSLASKDGQVSINVEDTGVGIAKSEIKRIFDAKYQVQKHIDLAQGAGMGLSIVKQHVQAHNGSIDVESNVDLGSRFSVTLPLSEGSVAPSAESLLDSPSIYATSEYFIHAREAILSS